MVAICTYWKCNLCNTTISATSMKVGKVSPLSSSSSSHFMVKGRFGQSLFIVPFLLNIHGHDLRTLPLSEDKFNALFLGHRAAGHWGEKTWLIIKNCLCMPSTFRYLPTSVALLLTPVAYSPISPCCLALKPPAALNYVIRLLVLKGEKKKRKLPLFVR